MSFLDELQKNTNETRTENNAVTNKSTLDPLLDFFSLAGAMRENPPEAAKLFSKTYPLDPLHTIRCMFYLRDIRGGQGERDVFRVCLEELSVIDRPVYEKVLPFIGVYGRWDDIFIGHLDMPVAACIDAQLILDEESMAKEGPVSMLAKWLPSESSSSQTSRDYAVALAELMGITRRQYKRRIVRLRKYIRLLEHKMSANQWPEIEYDKIPSQAGRKHVKAFKRHDELRYSTFLANAQKGEAKINTGTLFTYEIFDLVQTDPTAANAMWANLPDWTNGQNAIVLADVSRSMSGRPMSVSVSLALYFAEHNKGAFKDCFMTFSERPQVVKVTGGALSSRLRNIENREWAMNTNLEAALDAILQTSKTSPDDVPKILYVISDMEFDAACAEPNASLFENATRKYASADISMPHVVFWNVEARQNQAPATKFDNHVTLISGLSQSTFKYAVEGKTPIELMHEVLDGERYAIIEI